MNKNQAIEMIIQKVDDPDEPLFVLRGRDPLAAVAVLRWIHEAKDSGVNALKVDEAEDIAVRFLAYRPKKLPD